MKMNTVKQALFLFLLMAPIFITCVWSEFKPYWIRQKTRKGHPQIIKKSKINIK